MLLKVKQSQTAGQPGAQQAMREIGDAASWSLSSAKPGFGVHQLRDGNTNTYWQSDGPQPHCVNIQWSKNVNLSHLEIYSDLKVDESYTPAVVSVRCGSNTNDLREVKSFNITDANGWISLPLPAGVRASLCQIAILANFQNGRDTHLRQVLVYEAAQPNALMTDPFQLTTVEFSQHATLR